MKCLGFGVYVLLAMFARHSAWADIYTCNAAKEKAKVGVYSGNEVGVTSDKDNRECRFSVNGASAGSPPLSEVISALNLIIERGMGSRLRSGDTMPLAMVLLSSSSEASPPSELLSILASRAPDLAQCIDEFSQGASTTGVQDNNLLCRSLEPGSVTLRLGDGEGIEIGTEATLLVIAVARGGLENYLFVPRSFIGSTPFPTP